MQENTYLMQGMDNEFRPMTITMVISMVCHVLLAAILIYAPISRQQPDFAMPSVIHVSMVTLAETEPEIEAVPEPVIPDDLESLAVSAPEDFPEDEPVKPEPVPEPEPVKDTPDPDVIPEPVKPEPVKPEPVKPEPEKPEPVKPRPEKTEPVAKKIVDNKKVVPRKKRPRFKKPAKIIADTKLVKPRGPSREEIIKNAIANIRKDVKAASGNNDGLAGPGLAGKEASALLNVYQVNLAVRVERNWAFSTQMAGDDKDLEGIIGFSVMPSGQLKNIWFEKKSGNSYMDESIRKAVVKSNPFQAHPRGLFKPHVEVYLRYTPKGLNK
ncbi:TonB C-terminal domain-containing protein [Desulfobacterales bacterium HSG16]|nr:TonB C-terminal domain-containing protein [Desulfobacterales bacterium HSG16]